MLSKRTINIIFTVVAVIVILGMLSALFPGGF